MSFSIATNGELTRDFAIDTAGRLVLSTGADAVVDRLRTRLAMWLGDWYLDTTRGIDYKNKVLGRSRNGGEISAIIRREILLEPGVDQITAFALSQDSEDRRGFTVAAKVTLTATATATPVLVIL